MEKLTDVVYVLGTGSNWNNNEIRFSLRSLEKYGLNVGKVFVVGELPAFLEGRVIHLPCPDNYPPSVNADGNIARKVLVACLDSRLSDDFLFINDDHILLSPVILADIPAYHKGDMNLFPDAYWLANYWRSRLRRTMETLSGKGCTAFHYDCHTPVIFNKTLFPRVMAQFPIGEGIGLTMKSLYCNVVSPSNSVQLTTEKKTVFLHYSEEQLKIRLAGCSLMSFNDCGLNDPLRSWLYARFPNPSRWEISDVEDRLLEILRWANGPRDYQTGVRLFEKYMKGANLIQMFRSGESEYLRKKLTYKLLHNLPEQWIKTNQVSSPG